MHRTQIILIDSNMRRRAKVAFEMTTPLSYVIPLEDVAEICGAWPEEAVILIEDARDNLIRLERMMSRQERRLPVIAFCDAPSPQAEARARDKGALAYLAWPRDEAAMGEALNLAQAAVASAHGDLSKTAEIVLDATGPVVAIGTDPRGDYLIHDPHRPAAASAARNVTREVIGKVVPMPLARAH